MKTAESQTTAEELALAIIHAASGDPKRAREGGVLIQQAINAERERCARRVERFFAPCSGHLERRYGIELAGNIREGT